MMTELVEGSRSGGWPRIFLVRQHHGMNWLVEIQTAARHTRQIVLDSFDFDSCMQHTVACNNGAVT